MTSKLAGLVTLLGGGLWLIDEPRPVVHVNEQNSLMSAWPSEAIGSSLPPECAFWNQSVIFSDDMCSPFVVNRAAAAYQSAHARAMRCTAAYATECVLSPEVGLAMPAAFLYDHDDGVDAHAHRAQADPARVEPAARARLAARLGRHHADAHARAQRDGAGGVPRRPKQRARIGPPAQEEAFCVQLLRLAFEPACWARWIDDPCANLQLVANSPRPLVRAIDGAHSQTSGGRGGGRGGCAWA